MNAPKTPPIRTRKDTYTGPIQALADLDFEMLVLHNHGQRAEPERLRLALIRIQQQLGSDHDPLLTRIESLEKHAETMREYEEGLRKQLRQLTAKVKVLEEGLKEIGNDNRIATILLHATEAWHQTT